MTTDPKLKDTDTHTSSDSSGNYNYKEHVNDITEYSPQTRKELDINSCQNYNPQNNFSLPIGKDYIENTKQEIAQRDNYIQYLEEKNQEYYNNLEEVKNKYNSLKNESDKVQADNDNLLRVNQQWEQEFMKERSYHEKKLRSLETRHNEQLNKEVQNYKDLEKTCEESIEESKQWEQNYKEKKQEFKKQYKELQQSHSELLSQKQNMEQKFDKDKENYEKNINNLEQHITKQNKEYEQTLQQTQEQYRKIIDSLQEKLEKLSEKEDYLRELEEKNAKLKEEASKYQSALGVATNIRLGEEDQNHSVKLKQDILNLQDTLENYITNLKPNMYIDIEQVQILAQKYGCLSEITTENNLNRPFIKALLQRELLEDIFKSSRILLDHKGKEFALELDIELKAQELLELIEKFSTTRVGTDQIVNVAAIKVRQQVYGILGNRGFADIIDPDGNYVHNFINYVSDKLNKMMNQYRKINDVNRKKEVEAMAPELIQDVYKLFWFRLNVQEPKTQYKFFEKEKNCKIDPNLMKGRWDDDEIDQLCVDICYFPLIGQDLDSSNRKIYTHAKVFPRYIRSSSGITAEIRRLVNF